MKVSEIFQPDGQLTEEKLAEKLASFDWKYEFSDDAARVARGNRAMNVLENAVYQLWKRNPDRAVELWNTHSPVGRPGITPSFIIRLDSLNGAN